MKYGGKLSEEAHSCPPSGIQATGAIDTGEASKAEPAELSATKKGVEDSETEFVPDTAADIEAAAAYVESMSAAEKSQVAGSASRLTTTQIACMAIAAVATVACIICLGIYAATPISHESAANATNTVNAATTANTADAVNAASTTSTENAASSSAASAPAAAQADQILPDSNARYYTRDELEALSDRELYLARNEIYARHGRGFKNQDLVDWFADKDWYEQLYIPEEYDALPDQRNEYEHANADLMMEIEQERDSQYL